MTAPTLDPLDNSPQDTPLWSRQRVLDAFAKITDPNGDLGAEEIMFVINGICEEYEFAHDIDTATIAAQAATIEQLEEDAHIAETIIQQQNMILAQQQYEPVPDEVRQTIEQALSHLKARVEETHRDWRPNPNAYLLPRIEAALEWLAAQPKQGEE